MKFWGIFSKTIFKLFARRSFRKLRTNSIESVLARSVRMIDPQSVAEIKTYIKNKQTIEGGFADKGGKCDLYYSLFGCYIAEALEINEIKPLLMDYVRNIVLTKKLTGVYLKCAVILYIKLFGKETLPAELKMHGRMAAQYSDFINMLTYYYSEDYAAFSIVKYKFNKINSGSNMPCSVAAAYLILNNSLKKSDLGPWKRMEAFYKNGSFSAYNNTHHGDLLSTGVALYSLRFVDSDLSIIKPDCLTYIDSLYSDGGFCATVSDPDPDVEYTFYGLLALGSLSD